MEENSTPPPPQKSTHSPISPATDSDLHVAPPPDVSFQATGEQKPSKYRYLWLALIFFLIISVLGVGAYIIDAENKIMPSQISVLTTPTPEIPRSSPSPNPTVSASISAKTVDMSQWKTYKSTEGFFTLKYPPEYTLSENSRISVDGQRADAPNTVEIFSPKNPNFALSIEFKFDASKPSLENIEEQYGCNASQKKGIPYEVSGRQAVILEDTPCGALGATEIFLRNNSFVYSIEVVSNTSFSKVRPYIEQILSTLEFPIERVSE